jgi:hypothetical protein
MESSRIDPIALLAAVMAAALALTAARGDFGYLTTAGALTVLLVLFAYDQQGYRGLLQSLAFSAVCGFCLMLASGFILLSLNLSSADTVRERWLPVTFVVGTLVLMVVDRVRMSSRESFSMRLTSGTQPLSASQPTAPVFSAKAPPAPPAYVPPPPMPTSPTPPPAPASAAPIWTEPVAPAPPPPAPAPAAIPIPAGKETMIYLNLVGEGLNVLRTVRSEHLGRDFYRILDDMPEGETWEFLPGQVVRCKKQKLSNGKGLVAFEEAPRAT